MAGSWEDLFSTEDSYYYTWRYRHFLSHTAHGFTDKTGSRWDEEKRNVVGEIFASSFVVVIRSLEPDRKAS
jgi:hypothetical protein